MDFPIITGTMVSIWHGSKGKQYMVLGKTKSKKSIVLINHNCINNSGKIHASTVRALMAEGSPKSIKYVSYETNDDGINVAQKISRITGDKVINKRALAEFMLQVNTYEDMTALKSTHNVLADVNLTADMRTSARFI